MPIQYMPDQGYIPSRIQYVYLMYVAAEFVEKNKGRFELDPLKYGGSSDCLNAAGNEGYVAIAARKVSQAGRM